MFKYIYKKIIIGYSKITLCFLTILIVFIIISILETLI